jgi:hypothetical protein
MYPALRSVRRRLRKALAVYSLAATISMASSAAAFMGEVLAAGALTVASFAVFNMAYSLSRIPLARALPSGTLAPSVFPFMVAGWGLGGLTAIASMIAFLASVAQGIIVLANAALILSYTSLIYFEVSR